MDLIIIFATVINYKNTTIMGRLEINKEDLKKQFGALLPQKVIDAIGRTSCKRIAEEAVLKVYEKETKKKK